MPNLSVDATWMPWCVQATHPLHAELGLPLQTHQLEHAHAEYLPRPLYVLYVQTSAYREAYGELTPPCSACRAQHNWHEHATAQFNVECVLGVISSEQSITNELRERVTRWERCLTLQESCKGK